MKVPTIKPGPCSGRRSSADRITCFGLPLQHFEHRYALDPLFRAPPLEDRCLDDAEPNPHPDPDDDDADQEWNAPAPDIELVAGQVAEPEHRTIRQKQPTGRAELGPCRQETAVLG